MSSGSSPTCPSCSSPVSATAKFCSECGAALTPPVVETGPTASRSRGPERRQITVLFCDLVGSTELSTSLDPEEMREVIRAYHAIAGEQIERHGGHVAQYLGDGILVYFGYPVAQEDAASRAVATALALLEAAASDDRALVRKGDTRLSIRCGIHTGVVVIGSEEARDSDRLALGDVPNIAARIQGLAEPNKVLMSGVTAELVARDYLTRSRGREVLKGVRGTFPIHELQGERNPLDEWVFGRFGDLVNRQSERGILDQAWRRASSGEGHAILIRGVAGMGKSRLVHYVRSSVNPFAGEGRIEFRASQVHMETALHPFVEQIRFACRFGERETPEERRAKLEEILRRRGSGLVDNLPVFASLLSLPTPEGAEPIPPQELRERTHGAIEAWVLAHNPRGPLLIVFEDLHWMDRSSVDVIGRIIGNAAGRPVLVLLSSRTDFGPAWELGEGALNVLDLDRLEPQYVEELVQQLAGGRRMPRELVSQVVDRVDGVPIFVEELTKAVLAMEIAERAGESESAAGRVEPAIPATLQDSLMAQLDRLGTVRYVAQLAAVFGREVDFTTLQAYSELPAGELQAGLRRLTEADVLFESGSGGEARYLFRHALLREAAYGSLLKSQRRDLHRRIGLVLAAQDQERNGGGGSGDSEVVNLLAYHWRAAVHPRKPEAETVERAVGYLLRAAKQSLVVSGYHEAASHLQAGLDLIENLPAGRLSNELELAIRLHLNTVYQATVGWASDEARDTLDRCRELCLALGDRPELSAVLFGYFQYNFFLAKYPKALELAQESQAEATRLGDEDLLMQANAALSNSHFWLGHLDESLHHAQYVLERYDPSRHAIHAVTYGTDPGVWSYMLAVWVPWLQGRPASAERAHRELEQLAERLQHPFSMALALNTSCCFHVNSGNVEGAAESGRRLKELAEQHGLPVYDIFGVLFEGWAAAQMGRVGEIIEAVTATYGSYVKYVGGLAQTYAAMMAADVYRAAGRPGAAVEALDHALALAEAPESLETAYHAELVRMKGALMLEIPPLDSAEGEQALQRALDLATERRQPPIGLRAALDLLALAERRGSGVKRELESVAMQLAGFAETEFSDDVRRGREALSRHGFEGGAS